MSQKDTEKEKRALRKSQRSEEEKEIERQKDRERKAKKKLTQSDEEKAKERRDKRESMAKKRSEMTIEEQELVKAKDRDRKAKKFDTYVNDDWLTLLKEYNRLYNVKRRENQTTAAHEYEIVDNLLCMRRYRSSRNLEAKEEMRRMKEYGFIKPFQNRNFREIDECELWTRFIKRGKDFADILKQRNPEMATKVTEIIEAKKQKEAEKRAKEKEIEDRGYWRMNPTNESYYWTGINPPGPDNPHPDELEPEPIIGEELTPEDALLAKKWDELHFQWYREMVAEEKKERREERNRIARENYHKRKVETEAELLKPIEVPDLELSEYEKIREQNIKERNEALKAAGFMLKN